jgi:hypothetical protein
MPNTENKRSRRVRPLTTAVFVWNLWMRIPRDQRRQIIAQARKHGPRLLKQAAQTRRNSPAGNKSGSTRLH